VVIAPERGLRPGAGRGRIPEPTDEELETCPFCAGREDRTPPETLRLGEPWRVRVVPNLYPAFDRQEVVIHSPEHKRSFADLDDDEVRLVAEAWSRRRAAHPDGYVHACVNEGVDAGASLPHTHSQLVWLPDAPPPVTEETEQGLNELVAKVQSSSNELEIELQRDVLAFCPPASRVPYEVLIANGYVENDSVFAPESLTGPLFVLRSVIRRLRAVEGPAPWNAWLHVGSRSWHIEVLPRLTVFAGIELGAGIYVNALPPEEAAERLRNANPP
jgi:UDPglucose--hexose-1-phosphate uridylyltransferase